MNMISNANKINMGRDFNVSGFFYPKIFAAKFLLLQFLAGHNMQILE